MGFPHAHTYIISRPASAIYPRSMLNTPNKKKQNPYYRAKWGFPLTIPFELLLHTSFLLTVRMIQASAGSQKSYDCTVAYSTHRIHPLIHPCIHRYIDAYTYTRVLHLWTYTTGTYTNKRGITWLWICFQEVFCSFVSWHILAFCPPFIFIPCVFGWSLQVFFQTSASFLPLPPVSIDVGWAFFIVLHAIFLHFFASYFCDVLSLSHGFFDLMIFRIPFDVFCVPFLILRVCLSFQGSWKLLTRCFHYSIHIVLLGFACATSVLVLLVVVVVELLMRKALWTFEAGGRLGGGHSASPTGAQSRPLCLFACSGSASWSFCFCYSPSCPSSS